jgi:hypothetical protein
MTYWIAIFTVAILLGGLFLFVVGQYNGLVTARHRIATMVLEIDFLLQQMAADLEGHAHMTLEDGTMIELHGAQAASHRAASNPFRQGAHDDLFDARRIISSISERNGSLTPVDYKKHQLELAETRLRSLQDQYRGLLKKYPASWIARAILDFPERPLPSSAP